ncbi:hypothetical protein Tco_0006905 [Tanacetum coccineum]
MVRLWWPQPARPPPQRWRQAAEHREAPRGVTPPQPDTNTHGGFSGAVPWWRDSGGGSVVEKGKGVVAVGVVMLVKNGEMVDGDVGCDEHVDVARRQWPENDARPNER